MKKIIPFLLLFTLGISIAQYRTKSNHPAVQVMRELLPHASRFEPLSQSVYGAYASSNLIGYISMQKGMGYGGPISVLASYDTSGIIKDVRIIAHSETPSFLQHVINKGFLDTLKGKRANEPFQVGEDLNAVTSASYTSRGIALAVRNGAHELATRELHLPVGDSHGRHFTLADWLACALILLTLVFNRFQKTKKLRPFVLAASFLVIGIWQDSTLNLSNVSLLISGRIPTWNEMPSWFLLAVGVLLIILVTGLNLYCYWLCPFGCVTQTISKLGRFAGVDCKRPLQKKQLAGVDIRLWLAWFSLMLGFIVGNPGISVYEPFGTLFSFRGNTAQWILMAFALFTAVLIDRLWCRFLCPVGAICDLLATLRRKFKGTRRAYAIRD